MDCTCIVDYPMNEQDPDAALISRAYGNRTVSPGEYYIVVLKLSDGSIYSTGNLVDSDE